MKDTSDEILRYLRKQTHTQDGKIREVKSSIDRLDASMSEMRERSEKYFYVLMCALVSILGIVFYYGRT